MVMFLYKEDPDNPEFIKLNIAKHRAGSVGDIDLIFKGARQRFYGVEKKRSS